MPCLPPPLLHQIQKRLHRSLLHSLYRGGLVLFNALCAFALLCMSAVLAFSSVALRVLPEPRLHIPWEHSALMISGFLILSLLFLAASLAWLGRSTWRWLLQVIPFVLLAGLGFWATLLHTHP